MVCRLSLRDYQRAAVEQTVAVLDRRPILVAPAGSGKTVMAVDLVERLGVPTLWLAHRKELIDQARHRLAAHGLMTGVVMAGYPASPLARVQVASIQTLVRRENPPGELIIIDEAHHARAQSYRSVLDAYPEARVVGLTATPFRLDGRGLGDLFGEIVVAAHTDDLCDAGVLHRPKVWASSSPDVRGVKVVAGDYSPNALSLRANRPELNADIIKEWHRLAEGRRTVVFAVDVAHSRAIVAAFRDAGVPTEHLDGSTRPDDRDAILARLASGETLIVSNCMVLTEGWDLPVLECVIIARPTASLCLHIQMLGRVMRAAAGKDGAIVLDHAGNHHVHGLATRRLRYALDGTVRVGESDPLGMRRCQACGLFYDSKLATCPECEYAADRYARDAVPLTGEAQLAEFDDANFAYRQRVWQLIEAERQAMGFRQGWSFYRYKERFDAEPVIAEIDGQDELVDPPHATRDEKAAVYKRLLCIAADRGFAQGWASHRYRELFGCWPSGFVSRVRMEAFKQRLERGTPRGYVGIRGTKERSP